MIRLEKLTLRKLGNIAPDTELHFNDRGALLLGKNGTGKTTLLNVIAAVLHADWPWLFSFAPDGFELEYTLHVPTDPGTSVRLDVTMSGAPLCAADLWRPLAEADLHRDRSLKVVVRDSAESQLLAFTSDNHRTTFFYADRTFGTRSDAIPSPGEGLRSGDDAHRSAFDGAFHLGEQLVTFGEQIHLHDESSFERLTRDEAASPPLVTFCHRSGAREAMTFHSARLSRSTCEALRQEMVSSLEVPGQLRLEARSEPGHLAPPWLARFCHLTGLERAALLVPLVVSKRSSNKTIAQYGPMSLRYTTHGSMLRGDQLSFGQKRLFALLHYLDAHESTVLADEMVNGLHHEWIDRCVQLLHDRQAFLSSQNPILFDFMSFSSAQDAADRFIECSLDEQGRFVWRNMSLDDGNSFFELYQTGVQHVSEILRTRGYW